MLFFNSQNNNKILNEKNTLWLIQFQVNGASSLAVTFNNKKELFPEIISSKVTKIFLEL